MPNALDELTTKDLRDIEALCREYQSQAERFIAQGKQYNQCPDQTVREAFAELAVKVDSFAKYEWPRSTWRFREIINRMADGLTSQYYNFGADLLDGGQVPASLVDEWCDTLVDEISENFYIARPLPEPRVQLLETIEQLDAQCVSDRQIAEIYGWYNNADQPDLARVRRARAGLEQTPEAITLAGVTDNWPTEPPSLERVAALVQKFRTDQLPAPAKPKKPVESIADFDSQGVSELQIARAHGWTDDAGAPNIARVREQRKLEQATA